MSENPEAIIPADAASTGDQRADDELVELTKTKREAAHAAMLAFNLGVKSERERCASIADQFERDEIDYAARICAANIATDIRKDRGCDPPQGPPK